MHPKSRRGISSYYFLACIRNLTEGGAVACGLDCELEQVAALGLDSLGDGIQRSLDSGIVTVGTELLQTGDLGLAYLGVVDVENLDGILLVQTVLIDTDNLVHT